jgi:cytochrome P450
MVDLGDPASFADGPPHEVFERMREQAPVLWSDASPTWESHPQDPPGYWNLTRAQHIAQVSMDRRTFSSWLGGITMRPCDVGSLEEVRMMMIGKDGAEHARQRATVNTVFTPWRVRELQHTIRERVTGLIDAFIDRGDCELVADFAKPLVVHMIGDLLGVPEEDRDRLALWADALTAPDDPELAHIDTHAVVVESGTYLLELLHERQARPHEDLISALAQTASDGEAISAADQVGIFLQLVAAAIDSTRSTISTGTRALIEHPDQFRALREDPSLVPGAVEEMLRWAPAFNAFRRTARTDTEIGGVAIGKGQAMMLWYASGSRDPRAIDRPDSFDIRRGEACPHQAFGGGGRHFCLGSGLARQELVVVFEELAHRIHEIRLAEPPARTWSRLINGYKRMPITFTPRRQAPRPE